MVRRAELSLSDKVLGPIRLVIGFVLMTIYTIVFALICTALIPWRVLRIKAINYYGKIAGGSLMWLSGCPITIEGRENLDVNRPALYISNHTSIVDLFMGMWLAPVGTVGVAKKTVVWYPLLGQLYLLSGHLRIDRGNTASAIADLAHMGEIVRSKRLSIWMWPEGTRSRTGRLLAFKKGIVHLALQTRLPVVPVVVSGAQHAWVKNSLVVQRVPIRIQALPAVDTSGWTLESIEDHVTELHRAFRDALPEDQQPLPELAADAARTA